MKTSFLFICSACVLLMASCLENSTEPEVIIDYGVTSYFYVNNQTGSDLQLTYKIAFIEMDSTVTVPADTTLKIFQAGDIGMSPKPSDAFHKISVYRFTENQSTLFLTIDPVTDGDWMIVDEDLNEVDPESTNRYGEDGSSYYELVITNDD